MTRQEAIETAVRRHMRMSGTDPWYLLPSSFNAIRAHFRAVCHTYGVQ